MICYDYIKEYIRKNVKNNDGLLLEIEEYAHKNRIPIVQPEVAGLLRVLGQLVKPRRVLEIGTGIGYSAILFSTVLQDEGIIDTVEKDEEMVQKAKQNIARAGLDKTIHVIMGEASEVLRCLDKKYNMIFLDAAKGQYIQFLPECIRMLDAGGLLVSDNVLYQGMVANDRLVARRKRTIVKRLRDYLKLLCQSPELETSIVPIGDGVAISVRK